MSPQTIRSFNALLRFFGVILLVTVVSGQSESTSLRNIVLVHGAWADGSGWKGVSDILVKDGYNISIVQEPETSFEQQI